MTTIQIPATTEAVDAELASLGELYTATGWRRAALLAARVRLPGSGNASSGVCSPEQFAALGIHGLRSHTTVRLYVQNWLDAKGDYPVLGAAVELPEIEWPPTRTGTDGDRTDEGAARTVQRVIERHGPEVVARHVARAPGGERAIREEAERSIERRHAEHTASRSTNPALDEMDRQVAEQAEVDREVERLISSLRHLRALAERWNAEQREAAVSRLMNYTGAIGDLVALMQGATDDALQAALASWAVEGE